MKPSIQRKFNVWPKTGRTYTCEGRRVLCLGPDYNDHVFVSDKAPNPDTFYSVSRKSLTP